MRNASASIYKANVIFFIILMPPFVCAQDQSLQTPPNQRPLRVCSAQHPPPCATAPRPISTPDPEYSDKARKKKTQGSVVLHAVFLANGEVKVVDVLKSLPNGLTEEATKAATRIRFKPALLDGQPVPQIMLLEYGFNRY